MSFNGYKPWLGGLAVAFAGTLSLGAQASAAAPVASNTANAPRIEASKISGNQLTTLKGTVPLQVLVSADKGAMGQTEVIPSMTLLLKRSPEQQQSFESFLASLNNPASGNYHRWLTAKEVGERFGPNDQDVATVKSWLTSQGLGVKSVSPDKMLIHFSGPVAAVQRAFHTSMHRYTRNGKTHFANATEQQLPSALTPVVAGVASLNNIFPEPQVKNVQAVTRNKKGQWVAADGKSSNFNFVLNGDVFYDVVPADFNTIYNVNPLWSESTPIRGAGQTVAVLERTDVLNQDVATFRQTFLPTDALGTFSQIHPVAFAGDTSCADPGTNGDEGEAALDAEWAGAAAPDANVTLASCADSGSDFGAFLAAQNLLNQATPPAIMSLSYGECELVSAVIGDSNEADYLWSLAAARGVTVFVSSGDAGTAACDQGQSVASFGIAINGLASTPYNVSVGGTDFNDFNNASKYWAPGNGNLGASALGYIPEQTWNDSCASSQLYPILKFSDPNTACNTGRGLNFLDTAGGGGGPSYMVQQPSWQTGVYGMPQANMRATPDVALFAANGLYGHALIFCMSDASEGGTDCNYLSPVNAIFNSAGGTSFAAPAMAGIQALINQKAGASHGNIGPTLYDLARKQYGSVGSPSGACGSDGAGANCVFHDVTVGDIDVPCGAGTADCYSKGNDSFGVVSNGGSASLITPWKTGAGYDYATGLGSVNVQHLVNAVAAQDTRGNFLPTWDLFGFNSSGTSKHIGTNGVLDGHSTILMISSVPNSSGAADAQMLWMNGGTVVGTNPWDSVFAPGDQVTAIATDLFTGALTNQTVMESYNPVTNTAAFSIYSYGWIRNEVAPNPAGWVLVGSGVVDSTGVSKEIWRNNATGQLGFWSINCSGGIRFGRLTLDTACSRVVGNTIAATAGYTPRLADLNGDGYIDIVWTGPNNDIYYWINDGQGNFTKTYGGTFPAGWVLEGAGEVAGSGKTDLIWLNSSSHQMGWWIMNGAQVVDRQVRNVTSGYSIATIEDFDGDGLADILWTNSSGDAWVWQGTGGAFVPQHVADGQGNLYTIPAGYVVQKNRLQGVLSLAAGNNVNGSLVVANKH